MNAVVHFLVLGLAYSWVASVLFFGLVAAYAKPAPPQRTRPDVLMEARAIVWAHAREWVA